MIRSIVIVLLLLLAEVAAADCTIQLGTTSVIIHRSGTPGGLTYIIPHDNENTAVDAAKRIITSSGGWLIELQHGGTRNIRFTLHDRVFEFDPNRMFSDAGIRATLRAEGAHNYSIAAHKLVAHLAQAVLAEIARHRESATPIIALHNNTNGAFSITSYQTGNLQAEARQVNKNSKIDADDFFLVTSERLFNELTKKHQNVVLQSPTATDDGSLSVYAAKAGIPYVNVEAQAGHVGTQISMVKTLLVH